MNVTKLTISQETREKLSNPVLTPLKKRELREQLIMERIRKSGGDYLTKQELIVAGGFNPKTTGPDYANGLTLISSMIYRGLISHQPTSGFKKIWSVNEDVKVTPAPPRVADMIVNPEKDAPVVEKATVVEPVVEPTESKVTTSIELLDLAKDFAWQHNSDSLREFIAYAKNVIK